MLQKLFNFIKLNQIVNEAANNGQVLIDIRNVSKDYETAAGPFRALNAINLQVTRGEFVAVVGKSGSGKSTLINMFTGIDRPTEGTIHLDATPIHTFNETQMAIWRGDNLGIVFQFFQLLPTLTVVENVMLPMDFCDIHPPRQREQIALALLDQVDVVDHAYKIPTALSGGQQQRVAIARALANDPAIIVADEPTGNLDSKTSDDVFKLFKRLVADGKTIVMVTHDEDLAKQGTRLITIADGEIEADVNNAPLAASFSLEIDEEEME